MTGSTRCTLFGRLATCQRFRALPPRRRAARAGGRGDPPGPRPGHLGRRGEDRARPRRPPERESGAAPGCGPSAPGSPLTSREAEIAALIARGHTNKAIAAELTISPRTVDGHVERIFRKLDFTSRAQIASWVTAAHARPPA
ncbi:Uncharacterised protein [Amycolatopsis camponoti]|uniref:HTH luxR-type domain-containing protein n=1 Tax=Amycolatopsis camponoti TaxID=2606593 RepID=A0A6I8LPL7_9PSEU|nr:Uncharacterised protein [Amycolatopsis camponoti]